MLVIVDRRCKAKVRYGSQAGGQRALLGQNLISAISRHGAMARNVIIY